MYDADVEINVANMDDAALIRFAADCMRPTPDEHSVASSRLYDIATRVSIENTAQRRALRRSRFGVVEGGRNE
jgi:hypothetical protein